MLDDDQKKEKLLRQVWFRTGLVLIITILFLAVIIYFQTAQDISKTKNETISHTREQGLLLQRQLNYSLSALYAVAAIIQQGNGDFYHFDQFAENLLPYYPSITSLQLAKDAIVSNIYPLKGNEKAIGHDLLNDPNRMVDAKKAIETRQLTLSGPYNLIQGGVSVIGRLPIFLRGQTLDSSDNFWGFAIVVINLDTLLQATALQRLSESGYSYELARLDSAQPEKIVFAKNSEHPLFDSYDFVFDIPNAQWMISMRPCGGWLDFQSLLFRLCSMLIICAAITFIAWTFFRRPIILSNMVEKRTKELSDANQKLSENQKNLQYLARYDKLTNLPNRVYFHERLSEIMGENDDIANYSKVALLFLDLDKFKDINDQWGHDMGDEVLRQVAMRIISCIRECDIAGRLGGDEFVVLLPNLENKRQGEFIASKIEKAVSQPMNVGSTILFTTASIGIAVYKDDANNADELVKAADLDMYRQKKLRRNETKGKAKSASRWSNKKIK